MVPYLSKLLNTAMGTEPAALADWVAREDLMPLKQDELLEVINSLRQL